MIKVQFYNIKLITHPFHLLNIENQLTVLYILFVVLVRTQNTALQKSEGLGHISKNSLNRL